MSRSGSGFYPNIRGPAKSLDFCTSSSLKTLANLSTTDNFCVWCVISHRLSNRQLTRPQNMLSTLFLITNQFYIHVSLQNHPPSTKFNKYSFNMPHLEMFHLINLLHMFSIKTFLLNYLFHMFRIVSYRFALFCIDHICFKPFYASNNSISLWLTFTWYLTDTKSLSRTSGSLTTVSVSFS